MSDFKLYGKCETCRRKTFFVRKRTVLLPIGKTARSQKKMCGRCFRRVNLMLKSNEYEHRDSK